MTKEEIAVAAVTEYYETQVVGRLEERLDKAELIIKLVQYFLHDVEDSPSKRFMVEKIEEYLNNKSNVGTKA